MRVANVAACGFALARAVGRCVQLLHVGRHARACRCLRTGFNAATLLAFWLWVSAPVVASPDAAFERLKATATATELHRVLYALPKGGDLHNHASGSIHPDWLIDLARASEARGYRYYVKTRIDNCRAGGNEFGAARYLLLYRVVPQFVLDQFDDCERGEYVPLLTLDAQTRDAWQRALYLDKPFEGRAEFFEAQWSRLQGLLVDPRLSADALVRNMRSFGREGLHYLETQIPLFQFRTPTGDAISPEDALAVYRARLNDSDARASGVTVRYQVAVLRFPPSAEQALVQAYTFATEQPEILAVNLVGREDNDKGHPLRFLPTLRALRRSQGALDLSIHAGEVDEPNSNVRDTLLLGARRIGHGINLIHDPDTMRLMRHGPYLIEINLISNLLLEYVSDYDQHPFPEYLRTGIPVALSTDDRGMWDSTMTDEFFVAVREFDLSWVEVRLLIENSISYGFVDAPTRARLLATVRRKLERFERALVRGSRFEDVQPEYRGFLCRRYSVCVLGESAD
ncbi:MAG: adenosine deaminase [Pseudomonadota bacterium]